ncbi:MAG: hypothetical protein K2G38_06585, partial [Clostridia bacterium]|nr:hypothetical protein [Clostridia bacterium]
DKRYIIAVIITLICSITCGIVLFNLVNINIYFKEYASDYVFYVFNFKSSKLLFTHILSEIFYLYIFFLIGYFTKFKYLTLILIFIRGLYFAIYVSILFSMNAFGGITVAIIVFIPTSIISLIFCCATIELCKVVDKKICFALPAILALINTLILLILVNVVFRVVIVIV